MAEITIDEMEDQLTAAKPPVKAADIKLEASDLPDFAQGKTAADLAEEVARTRAALRISEDARLSLKSAIENRADFTPVRQEPVVEAPKALSREELQELARSDPMAVFDYMAEHLQRNLATHMDNRFKPIVEATTNSAEAEAMRKYKEEFELFPDQIKVLKTKVNPNVLGSAAGWDDMISYIRGQPGNFDKLVERRTSNTKTKAREQEAIDTGFSPTVTARTPVTTDGVKNEYGLDSVQMEICKTMGISPEDYKRYS